MLIWIFLMALLVCGMIWAVLNAVKGDIKIAFLSFIVMILLLALIFLPLCGSHEETKEYKLIRIENGKYETESLLVLEDNGTQFEISVYKSSIVYEDAVTGVNYTIVKLTRLTEDGFIFHTDGKNINDISATIYLNV